jgi:diacylglycerol kinase family enzyme
VVAVANGKAFGHSLYIAPDAELDDGVVNIFICKGIPLMKFLLYLQKIGKPKKINDSQWIEYRTTERVEIKSGGPPLPVEADGELIGLTPITCSLSKKAIRILA